MARGAIHPPRRGSVVVIVIWSVAIAAVIVGAAQVLAFRQVAMGRESVAKIEARWAARAGIEETIAVLEYHTEEPNTEDSRQLYKDLNSSPMASSSRVTGRSAMSRMAWRSRARRTSTRS